MDIIGLTPRIPLWAVFTGTFLLVILTIFLGYMIGGHGRKRLGGKEEGPVGSVAGATLELLSPKRCFIVNRGQLQSHGRVF